MKGRVVIAGLFLVTACSKPVSDNASDISSVEAADKAPPITDSSTTMPASPASLSFADLSRVCRAAVAGIFGHSPSIMKVTNNSGGIARVQYKRPDDGKIWKNDCKVEGQRVIWRSVDAFAGSGAGPWRIRPADEVITYHLNGSKIEITTDYGAGEKASQTFIIS